MEKKKTLLEHALHEGVVTHLTQVVDPTLQDHTVMLWTKEEWASAQAHRDKIITEFAVHRDSPNPALHSAFMILGKNLKAAPRVPSRTGHYVGLLAARAWARAHPEKGPAELIAANANELWKAFLVPQE